MSPNPQPPAGSRLVYSTEVGRVCPNCGRPARECGCRGKSPVAAPRAINAPPKDGVVRVSRDKRNRRGKTATVVTGVPADPASLREIGTTLKRLCGSGGTVKDGVIEIQGDHRELVASRLTQMGYRVKLAGG